jgi:hypothetical protein
MLPEADKFISGRTLNLSSIPQHLTISKWTFTQKHVVDQLQPLCLGKMSARFRKKVSIGLIHHVTGIGVILKIKTPFLSETVNCIRQVAKVPVEICVEQYTKNVDRGDGLIKRRS